MADRKRFLKVHWTAGHIDVHGSETTGNEARRAAEGTTSRNSDLPAALGNPVKHNKSKQHFNGKLKTHWKEECANSPYAERMKQINPSLPISAFHAAD